MQNGKETNGFPATRACVSPPSPASWAWPGSLPLRTAAAVRRKPGRNTCLRNGRWPETRDAPGKRCDPVENVATHCREKTENGGRRMSRTRDRRACAKAVAKRRKTLDDTPPGFSKVRRPRAGPRPAPSMRWPARQVRLHREETRPIRCVRDNRRARLETGEPSKIAPSFRVWQRREDGRTRLYRKRLELRSFPAPGLRDESGKKIEIIPRSWFASRAEAARFLDRSKGGDPLGSGQLLVLRSAVRQLLFDSQGILQPSIPQKAFQGICPSDWRSPAARVEVVCPERRVMP